MYSDLAAFDRIQRCRGAVILAVVGLSIVALGARLISIHVASGSRLRASADRQHNSRSVIPARRGMILDRSGRVVATSRLVPDVFIDPALVEDIDSLADKVGIRLGIPPSEVLEAVRRRSDSRYVVVASGVDAVAAEAIRDLEYPAVGLSERSHRMSPLGSSMAHVLGFVGRDGRGLEGIELAFDEHLRGRDGMRATIRDARRRALWRSGMLTRPPEDGGHVVLTIDAEIQRITESALERAVVEHEAQSGVAIVMVPQSGEILAMACYPTFDPAHASTTDEEVRRNRAVTDPVEPGSTFKPFIAGGALAGGFVSTVERFDCHMGKYRAGRRLIQDTSPHGMMTLQQIVCKSSNIGMAQVGQRMGARALHETVVRFGFGRVTGIDFPGESAGMVHPLDRWNSYSVTSIPMGYEIGVTPLQLITAFSAILNDGLLARPKLVKRLLAPDGRVVESSEQPEPVRRALPVEVARYLSQVVLPSVMTEGSGRRVRLEGYRALGKTGTAKLAYRDHRGYEPGAYLASLIAAAPVQNPRIAALVMVRRPNARMGYYGIVVCGSAIGDILGETLAYLQVPPGEQVAASGEAALRAPGL